MKKTHSKKLNEINIYKTTALKKHIQKRKKEKFLSIISLQVIWWVVAFLLVSFLLLYLSYITSKTNVWLSGVLVSVACGIVTGVIVYFLSNFRSNKVNILQCETQQIFVLYKKVCDVIFEKSEIDNSRYLGSCSITVREEADALMKKIDALLEFFYEEDSSCAENIKEIINIKLEVYNFWKEYEKLHDDNDRNIWIASVSEFFTAAKTKLEVIINKNSNKVSFIKKSIF